MKKSTYDVWPLAVPRKIFPYLSVLTLFFFTFINTSAAGSLSRAITIAPHGVSHYSTFDKNIHVSENNFTLVVKGVVKSEKGEGLPGVSIKVKGTRTGTSTAADGSFSIAADVGQVLVFTYIGYAPVEITVTSRQTLEVTLTQAESKVDEVVVVGYGTQKKVNLTGAVQVVSGKELENRPAANVTALLQGNANGIVFNAPASGFAPGRTQTIAIRGNASLNSSTPPLVVIDGIPTNMEDFNTLNPDDVESVAVMKDAAASAIYGSRAPYGVLIVTLKKGRRNQKPTFTYAGSYAIVKPVNYPDPLDAYTFALARNESYLNSRQSVYFNPEQLAIIKGNVENPGRYTIDELVPLLPDGSWGWGQNGMTNTNWFKVWLKDSRRQTHELSLRGGTEKTNYFVSAGYLSQPGIFKFVSDFDNYKRFSLNGGFNTDINSWIKLGFRTRYSLAKTVSPTLGGTGMGLLYGFMYGAWPVVPEKNPNGHYNQSSRIEEGIQGGQSRDDQHRLDNVLEFNLNPAKGWDIHIDGTWRMFFGDYQALNNQVVHHFYADGRTVLGGSSSISKTSSFSNYWTTQGYTSYNTTLGKHFVKIMAGMQAEETNNRGLSGSGGKMLIPNNYSINLSQQNKTASDAMSTWSTAGFFGRLNYMFDERFLLELNGRYDGSARYARNKRWGFFPSMSAGWNISSERFWEKLERTVNFAKIKASYGTLGDQGNTANFLYIPTLTVSPNTAWVFGGQTLPYVNTPGLLNPDITWNKITTLNLGTELKFLDNRLSAEFDWFHRKSWDMLGPPSPVPSVLGTSAPSVNNAAFVTRGFELQLGWRDNITPKLDYGVRLYLSDAQSTITKYNVARNYVGQWYPGMKLGEIWGYHAERLLNQGDFNPDNTLKIAQSIIGANWYPGDVKYEKLDNKTPGAISTGDGTVENPGDRRIIGNSTPRYTYSINLNLGYAFDRAGRLDFSMLAQGVGKRDQVGNYSMYYWGMGSETGNNSDVNIYDGGKQLDFYRDASTSPELLAKLGTNTNAFFPRPYIGGDGFKNFQPSDRYLISLTYLRIKNMQFTYTLPGEWLRKARLQSCRIYFSGENLVTFRSSSLPYWVDPEMPASNSYSSWVGRNYFQQATYSFGINLGF
ncbi:SusC/RagA family TonB-linked outer membrane protein [Chitinophaga rhizosphaerae]|uniref:SusC/RagA family TonB-linked outer membrane protein n=1 Tax=Chitinophaga rhizosphaerae TaxID=1864947 RepID=UPI000F805B59|nr:TonB-dependent receptor [Chitinophaga rhizosphaerae]